MTEIIITIIIQITEIAVIVITEIIIITAQITIAEIIQNLIHDHHINLHDHHINLDHLIIETEFQILLIIITEADTKIMTKIEIQITETKVMDETTIAITVTTKNLINNKVEME